MEHPLRQFRTAHKLDRRELADRLGISAVHAWRLEEGKQGIAPKMAIKIEETLGIPRWQLRPDLWAEPERIAS